MPFLIFPWIKIKKSQQTITECLILLSQLLHSLDELEEYSMYFPFFRTGNPSYDVNKWSRQSTDICLISPQFWPWNANAESSFSGSRPDRGQMCPIARRDLRKVVSRTVSSEPASERSADVLRWLRIIGMIGCNVITEFQGAIPRTLSCPTADTVATTT